VAEKKAWLFERDNVWAWYYDYLFFYDNNKAKALDVTAKRLGIAAEEVAEIVGESLEEATK
jgi:hypothetical protein